MMKKLRQRKRTEQVANMMAMLFPAAGPFCGMAWLLFSCAGTGTPVLPVTELAPPGDVAFRMVRDSVEISWQASKHETLPVFAGYNIYISTSSLTFAASGELPPPIVLPKGDHSYRLARTRIGQTTFVHVRSRSRNGELSLPSLPELCVKPE